MMKNSHFAVIFAILAFVSMIGIVIHLPDIETNESSYDKPLPVAPKVENPLAGIGADYSVGEDFTTHLPIVIIDTGNERPPINTVDIPEEERRIPIPGVEPYRYGSIKIIETGGINTLTDTPSYDSPISMKRRGNMSMGFEKPQYLVKLLTESGQDNYLPLLGMGAESEWVLNGSMADKSMIRNYLAYSTADKFIPMVPDSEYCEVLYHQNGQFYYEGVYLLLENIRQGPDRVDIPKAKYHDPFPSYIVRRDRKDDEGIMLNTWATANALSSEYLGLIYPSVKSATPDIIEFVTQDISKIEQILYSDNAFIYATYSEFIDIESFVDYFLINEFFANYDAGLHSTFMYKKYNDKLNIGPVWDFDNGLDNYTEAPLAIAVTAFQIHPWFDRLMLDASFLEKLDGRYAELRRGPLSDTDIVSSIDEITNYLGPAIDREWARWETIYTVYDELKTYSLVPYEDDDGDILIRDSNEHRFEIYRLKTSITQHAAAIAPYLQVLKDSCTMRTGMENVMGLFLITALLCFAVPAFMSART
ncbi:CotH kinase family protein [Lachnospiraceae bacterium ZAX-1]